MLFLVFALSAVPAYILGSVNGAIIASKFLYHKDIRDFGSGNPGLTNFYRVFGKGGALLVITIDVLKTVAPVLFGGFLFGRFLNMTLFGREFTGLFVILGHCFPLFYNFKGGKGIMAAGTLLFAVDWRLGACTWGVFIITIALTKYVSLGSVLAAAAYPLSQLLIGVGGSAELIVASISAVLLIVRHHANIKRLIRGTESKIAFRKNKKNH